MSLCTVRVFLFSTHWEPRIRVNKLAPSGYGFILASSDVSLEGWGFGSEKSTEDMLARGLGRALEKAHIEFEPGHVELITRGTGSFKYLNEFVPKWREQHKHDGGANRTIWFTVQAEALLATLSWRTPTVDEERAQLKRAAELARAACCRAREDIQRRPDKYVAPGLFCTSGV